jgi:hypothetical protein
VTDNLTAHEAAEMIRAILDRIPDAQLPEARMEGDVAWFGSHGYHIGSATINGKPGPANHRRSGISDLFAREAAHRLEVEHWSEVTA